MNIKILLAGDGGQGVQTIAEVLARAAFQSDKQITLIPNYGLEQRGGVSLSFIQIGDDVVSYPKFTKPDLLLLMSKQAIERTEQFQNAEKIINFEDYGKFLEENKVPVQSYNIFFLGLITRILEEKKLIKENEVTKILEDKLSKKNGWEENKKAFDLGFKI